MDGYYNNYSDNTEKVRPYLQSGEEILWSGRPGKSLKTTLNIPVLIFALVWLSMLIFVFGGSMIASGDFFMLPFMIPFFLVGFFMLYASTFAQSVSNKKTYYFMTDKRIIVLRKKASSDDCKSYLWDSISSVNLKNVRDGRGTVEFSFKNIGDVYNTMYNPTNVRVNGRYMNSMGLVLVDIDNVNRVYNIAMDRLQNQ